MTMLKVYENKDFIILGEGGKHKDSFILFNKRKGFENGHTHIRNYGTAKWVMELYQQRKIPLQLKSTYLLQSLIRISDDEDYSSRIQKLIEVRQNKSPKHYINVQKGVAKKKPRMKMR